MLCSRVWSYDISTSYKQYFNIFQDGHQQRFDYNSPSDYQKELCVSINDIYNHVIETPEISKVKMQQHYNRNLRVIHYQEGQKVWLKTKHYKTGENRKLAPRRNGPWTVCKKLPNRVNFRIQNSKGEQKVVHHDRLLPAVAGARLVNESDESVLDRQSIADTDSELSYDSSSESDFAVEAQDSNDSEAEVIRQYPRRERQVRKLPGTIPWGALAL